MGKMISGSPEQVDALWDQHIGISSDISISSVTSAPPEALKAEGLPLIADPVIIKEKEIVYVDRVVPVEVIKEVEKIVIREVPKIEVREIIKEKIVEIPVERIVERVEQIEIKVPVEKLVEVPTDVIRLVQKPYLTSWAKIVMGVQLVVILGLILTS